MKKQTLIPFVYAFLILILLSIILSTVSAGGIGHINSAEALAAARIDKECVIINSGIIDKFCNRLLSPSEIDAFAPDEYGTPFKNYATYRVRLPVTEGVNYGISCSKSDYAVNVFVDGRQVAKTGNVAADRESFKPSAAAYEAFFTGNEDVADVVIQQANYNHSKHYDIWFIVGPAEKVAEYNRRSLTDDVVVTMLLLTAAMINIGMFLCLTKSREILYFSMICFMAAVNAAFPYITSHILPGINWYLSHKLETCSLIAVMFFAVCYAERKFSKYCSIAADRIAMCVTAAFFLFFAVTPSLIYTKYNDIAIILIAIGNVPAFAVIAVNIVRKRKTVSQSNMMALIGIAIYLLIAICVGLRYIGFSSRIIEFFNAYGLTTGVSFYAFFNSLAISIDFRRSNELYEESVVREKELSQANEMLTRIDKIRESFLADLSHELKTPLTVIAANAAVASKQITYGKADEMTAAILNNVEREAVRLGVMVERLKTSAIDQHSEKTENLKLNTVLNAAAEFCIPLCARNGNTLNVNCADSVEAFSSANTVFHCLYNLITNATRHCENSVIELAARNGDGCVIVSVTDHGNGMNAEEKKHAFERGYSGDSGTGIGLPLCRELLENEGGSIYLEDTPDGGLTVNFTLKEANKNAENTVG